MTEPVSKTMGPGVDQSGGGQRPFWGEPDAPAIGDWLHVAADGTIEVYSGKAEMGQNIRTSLAQAVAEELRVPIERVQVALGDTARTPFDLGTFGSRTTPSMASRLHRVAASARELLIDLAAQRWGVPRVEVIAEQGQLRHLTTGRSLGYGDLTGGRRLTEHYSENAPVTPPDQWTIDGTSIPKVNARAMVTGQHAYTPDLHRPGLLVGKVLRPPAFQAQLTALDTAAAAAIPGVVVVQHGSFVGVAAPDRATAERAVAAIRAQWTAPPQISNQELEEFLRHHPAEPEGYHRFAGPTSYTLGDLAVGRAAAAHTLAATYTTAYIAHNPLEPHAAVAEWEDDRLTVWTGTQRPFGVRGELAAAFGLDEEQVRVIVPDTGAAYGGKHTGDAALEAARLARAAGRPVKLVWTREEELTWAYFRPAALIDVRSAVRADGEITAWEYTNYNSGPEAIRPPYAIANQQVTFQPTVSPLRQGSYRALAATANTFARESHLDELAHAIGLDPLAFRQKNLHDPRLEAVLAAAATRFGWGHRQPAPGHGFGLAASTEKDSYVATCAEVAVDPTGGQVRLVRVVEAFECGAIVNPDGLQNQVVGAIVQAIGGALFEQIRFANGRVLNDRLTEYRVPRFSDLPAIDVVLLDRRDLPSAGAGETPIVGLAPAVANAIFAATGVRLRSLPLAPLGVPVPRVLSPAGS
jgi:nicotinate dehydrogenase subunit B